MRVLVTGGAGYVGSRAVAHLLGAGFDVVAFDRLDFGAAGLLPFVGRPHFRLVRGDVRDRSALERAMQGCDAVAMLAAIVGEPACMHNPVAAEEINRDAALSAIASADSLGIDRFVFFSTCSNYGVVDAHAIADENAPLKPLSLYAQTKVEVERFAVSARRHTAVTVLRLGTICGLSGRMRFDLLVNDVARAAALGQTIEIYKPEAWRPFLHIDDVGRVVERILSSSREAVAGRIFNVVGENYQKRGLAELALKHFPSARVVITDARADNRDYRVSAEHIARTLGFRPVHSVESAFVSVARAVADGVFVDPLWPGYCATPLHELVRTVAV